MKKPLPLAQTHLSAAIANLALVQVSIEQAAMAEGLSDQEREELAALRASAHDADTTAREAERRLEEWLAARRARQAIP